MWHDLQFGWDRKLRNSRSAASTGHWRQHMHFILIGSCKHAKSINFGCLCVAPFVVFLLQNQQTDEQLGNGVWCCKINFYAAFYVSGFIKPCRHTPTQQSLFCFYFFLPATFFGPRLALLFLCFLLSGRLLRARIAVCCTFTQKLKSRNEFYFHFLSCSLISSTSEAINFSNAVLHFNWLKERALNVLVWISGARKTRD